MATALITGIAGQDGVLLARQLLGRGYRVVGLGPQGSRETELMLPYLSGVELVKGDVRDSRGFAELLDRFKPAEVYNLAALSSVGQSWDQPELVAEINAIAVVGLLEQLRRHRDRTKCEPRFFQASSAEIFGVAATSPQKAETPHHPRNPYATSKSFAHNITANYRESFGLFACSGVLYNHESVLRPTRFVTRKITQAVAEIRAGSRESLTLGNIDVRRDWGAASDYVEAIWRMLQHSEPRDYVIATGESRPLRQFVDVAFRAGGLGSADQYLEFDHDLYRPTDIPELCGDPSVAGEELGWSRRWSFEGLVGSMVRADIARTESGVAEVESLLDESAS